MKWVYVFLLFLCACAARQDVEHVAVIMPADRKLKQKVIILRKKLENAERALAKQQEEVDSLSRELCEVELRMIETQVGMFEEKWKRNSAFFIVQEPSLLFLQERETLHQIMQTGYFPFAVEQLLDRILLFITQVSDLQETELKAG